MPPFVGRVAKVGESLTDQALKAENFVQRLDKMDPTNWTEHKGFAK
jgi:hypothetical protein